MRASPASGPSTASWSLRISTCIFRVSSRTVRQLGVSIDPRSEQVFEAFDVSGIPIAPGLYDFSETAYRFRYNRSAPVNFGLQYNHGGFFGGSLKTIEPTVNARYGDTLNLSLSYSRNDIDLPGGSTVTNLTNLNVAYNFTTRLYAQTLLQHNDSDHLWAVNFRLGWLQDAKYRSVSRLQRDRGNW